jgi:hypothetical protein
VGRHKGRGGGEGVSVWLVCFVRGIKKTRSSSDETMSKSGKMMDETTTSSFEYRMGYQLQVLACNPSLVKPQMEPILPCNQPSLGFIE